MPITHRYATALADIASPVTPRLLKGQKLAMVNHALAVQLQLPESWWQDDYIIKLLCSPTTPLTRHSVAQKYAGHQFGQWNPFLGDGRGLLLGEVEAVDGQLTDLHLKGAGPTPYSRGADGRAVLRSTLREYLGSEALHALNIPSSRGLCLFASDDTVYREQPEPGAMMIRTAPSHIRFGHFEHCFHARDTASQDALFDFVFTHHYPECRAADNPHAALLRAITLKTARLVALWQCHGFVHGVMNSDNMSIHGITFDYGPYAFIDNFKADAVFNHSDHQGRYAFDQQPGIALWNLNVLAHSFSNHCSTDELRAVLQQFEPTFIQQFQFLMCERMGLSDEQTGHVTLVNQWLAIIEKEHRDYTSSFRKLVQTNIHDEHPGLRDDFIDRTAFDTWWHAYRHARMEIAQSADLLKLNPAVIPRTHLLQHAIEHAEEGDFSAAESLFAAITSPFDVRWDDHEYSRPPAHANTGMLSCSS